MKTASTQLAAFLNTARTGDQPFSMANCYTLTLSSGVVECFTDWDQNIVWGGATFLANSVLIQGLKLKVSLGLEVDRQQLTIAAWPGATIGGAPWLPAIRDGAFDGAWIQRDRVFMSPALSGGIDGVTMFKGRVSTVDRVGRTSAQIRSPRRSSSSTSTCRATATRRPASIRSTIRAAGLTRCFSSSTATSAPARRRP